MKKSTKFWLIVLSMLLIISLITIPVLFIILSILTISIYLFVCMLDCISTFNINGELFRYNIARLIKQFNNWLNK